MFFSNLCCDSNDNDMFTHLTNNPTSTAATSRVCIWTEMALLLPRTECGGCAVMVPSFQLMLHILFEYSSRLFMNNAGKWVQGKFNYGYELLSWNASVPMSFNRQKYCTPSWSRTKQNEIKIGKIVQRKWSDTVWLFDVKTSSRIVVMFHLLFFLLLSSLLN